MALSDTLVKMSPIKGEYYLVEREKTEELYRNAGYNDEEEQIPNFINIDGKECFFTENFIEKDGKEFEIVIVANGFSWEDIIIYEDEEE
ncbi:hypothetical protein [Spirobacillus cienkowskii]|jgi:hypothetical protein|uniref:Uncharacterized protein n=1 Tax=Spirobacillus cienkowskii TaxID=495820 RepID=A0A369KU89_9BACT|nr:MAG: hypothetical protein DCC88_01400 [Spirobacillus cienkowskii]